MVDEILMGCNKLRASGSARKVWSYKFFISYLCVNIKFSLKILFSKGLLTTIRDDGLSLDDIQNYLPIKKKIFQRASWQWSAALQSFF